MGTMEHEIITHRVGKASIIKIPELALNAGDARILYPESDPSAVAEAARGLAAGSLDPETACCAKAFMPGWCGHQIG